MSTGPLKPWPKIVGATEYDITESINDAELPIKLEQWKAKGWKIELQGYIGGGRWHILRSRPAVVKPSPA